jgi:hypothetical protein
MASKTAREKWKYVKTENRGLDGRVVQTTHHVVAEDGRQIGIFLREEDARLAARAPQVRQLKRRTCKMLSREDRNFLLALAVIPIDPEGDFGKVLRDTLMKEVQEVQKLVSGAKKRGSVTPKPRSKIAMKKLRKAT